MTLTTCNRAYILRISNTIRQFVFLQSLQVLIFIAIINFSVFNPLKWLSAIFDNCTSGFCWLCYILNTSLLFGMTVRYSKNYTLKYLLITSRFTKIKKLFTVNSQALILISLIFGLANSYFHLLLTGCFNNEQNGELLASVADKKCFVIAFGPFMALYYFIKYNFKEEIIQYPLIHQDIRKQVKSKVKHVVCYAATLSMYSLLLYIIIYCICGYKIFQYWNVLFDTEDSSFNILEFFNTNIMIYLFTFGVFFYTTMLMMHELFVLNLTQPMEFPIEEENAGEGDLLMRDALRSEIPLIKMLAFQDLSILTERNSARRHEIYAITLPGGQGRNWKDISSECMKVLERFIDGLTKTYPKLKSTKIPNCSKPIGRTNLDVLLGPVNFRSYPSQVLNNKDELKPIISLKDSILKKLYNLPGVTYLFGDTDLLHFKQIISESQIVIWTNLSLTMLLKMSLCEDQFGVTHNDFPRILELMLKLREFLSMVNKITIYKSLSIENNLQTTMTTSLEVNIRICIYILSYMYKPYISKMKLSEEIKEKLNYYSAWNEG